MRTSSARWRSTASRAPCSAWPTTAPATAPTARPGAARLLLAGRGVRAGRHVPAAAARGRRRRDPPAVAHGAGARRRRLRRRAPLDAAPAVSAHVPENELAVVRQMIRERIHAPLARGVGRYFDALRRAGPVDAPRRASRGRSPRAGTRRPTRPSGALRFDDRSRRPSRGDRSASDGARGGRAISSPATGRRAISAPLPQHAGRRDRDLVSAAARSARHSCRSS